MDTKSKNMKLVSLLIELYTKIMIKHCELRKLKVRCTLIMTKNTTWAFFLYIQHNIITIYYQIGVV